MKKVRLFEEFINEGIFHTYNELVGVDYKQFKAAFEKLNDKNIVIIDKKNDVEYGTRKGQTEAFWKYDADLGRLYHSEKDRDVLGLINFYNMVKKNHPWSK